MKLKTSLQLTLLAITINGCDAPIDAPIQSDDKSQIQTSTGINTDTDTNTITTTNTSSETVTNTSTDTLTSLPTNTVTETRTETITTTDSITETQTDITIEQPIFVVGELDRSDWILDASNNTVDLSLSIDGLNDTRWSTNEDQANGQWISIDLGNLYTFNTIVFEHELSENDYPRGYEVEISTNGVDWDDIVASGVGEDSTTVIYLGNISTQYIRINQTGSSDINWWSIHEIMITDGLGSTTDPTDTATNTDTVSNCPGVNDLQNCMSDMSAQGGGTIILANQTYLLTETLDLRNNVYIEGQGSDTLITWDDSVKDTIDEPLLWSSFVDNVSLKNFSIECSIDQDPTSSDLRNDQVGLYLFGNGDPSAGEETDINNIYLESLEVFNCSHGVHIKGATDVTAIDLNLHNNGNTEIDLFHNIYWRRVGNLIVKQTSDTSGGYYDSPRGHGIRGSHLNNVYFENLSVFNNADHGVHVDNVYNMRLHNMDIYENCANPSGTCNAFQCYQDCEIDWDAPSEDL